MNSLAASAHASSASCSREKNREERWQARPEPPPTELHPSTLDSRPPPAPRHLVDLEVAAAVAAGGGIPLCQSCLEHALEQRARQLGVGRLAAAAAAIGGLGGGGQGGICRHAGMCCGGAERDERVWPAGGERRQAGWQQATARAARRHRGFARQCADHLAMAGASPQVHLARLQGCSNARGLRTEWWGS